MNRSQLLAVSPDDLRFCWEQVLANDSWFKLSYSFVPKKRAIQVLALHALFAMFERPLLASDESVATIQLGWWRDELSAKNLPLSRHPVVRTLHACGAFSSALRSSLEALLVSTYRFSLRQTISDESEWRLLCSGLGEAKLRAELALIPVPLDVRPIEGRCAGAGLGCIVMLAARNRERFLRYLPLDLQARHQVTLPDFEPPNSRARAAIAEVRHRGESWFGEQLVGLSTTLQDSATANGDKQQVFASHIVQRLKFQRAMECFQDKGRVEIGSWRLRDLFGVWRGCRQCIKREVNNSESGS